MPNPMFEMRLYLLQRLTAILMLPMVIGHLATIMYATRSELTAASILERTQSSPWLVVFYTGFVILVSIHAPLGLRKIMGEWLRVSPKLANRISVLLFLGFLGLGLRGVWALTGGTMS
ncbi:MAG: succinate dehydrogenase [Proteobacteria bacterium]|jgi:fumarate reductase subunit C|nr:succinate dehydrogenase [Pseudomonadota bacterium]MDA1319766.1 succinate dehydrogenase [Pseudomonadota bacterium]MDC1020146.1 succinate dehydrogenase [Alphaproteobacteria bacterium]